VKQQNDTALQVAKYLEAHPKIERVYYPGLASHPDHEIATKQMTGFGGVVSFEVAGDLQTTGDFIDRMQIPYIAPSLGGVESLIEQPFLFKLSHDFHPHSRDSRFDPTCPWSGTGSLQKNFNAEIAEEKRREKK
jgi:cystathionine beta-lyase/cystathionine gamma-synthase